MSMSRRKAGLWCAEASEDGLAHFKGARGDLTARLPEDLEARAAMHTPFWSENPPKKCPKASFT